MHSCRWSHLLFLQCVASFDSSLHIRENQLKNWGKANKSTTCGLWRSRWLVGGSELDEIHSANRSWVFFMNRIVSRML
ncbi:hypothetical protein BJV77DRAFT_1000149 [Russula vinacea]|nr:hypothetical protein BJV77DRAFT_1000149 [Russula vinacea]